MSKQVRDFWLIISQQNSVWQKVQLNVKYNGVLFYDEIKSLGGKISSF